jgi:predicted CopG family antitoxin
MMAKSVKVHDDTHRVLKLMKGQKRSKSIDEVIREMIKTSTGLSVNDRWSPKKNSEITSYMEK